MEQFIGIAAGTLTSISMLPQIFKVLKEKKAEQISLGYLAILISGLILWIVYGIIRQDTPVIATNVFSLIISLVMVILSLVYKKQS